MIDWKHDTDISATRISVGKIYHASPLLVWDYITDTARWPRWGPMVKSVHLPERLICEGSRGRVLTTIGIRLPFVITEYEHICFWNWKVASIKATGHRIQVLETGGCYLWFEVPKIAAPYILVCQMPLGRIEKLLAE